MAFALLPIAAVVGAPGVLATGGPSFGQFWPSLLLVVFLAVSLVVLIVVNLRMQRVRAAGRPVGTNPTDRGSKPLAGDIGF